MRAENLRKGPWYEEEDERLEAFVCLLGERRWDSLARASGLRRSGKSCRLRWLNYLRPCLKHGPLTPTEEQLIIHLHEKWGNKWADIARRLPGRTDNEIKNYWRTHVRKKLYAQSDSNSLSEETSCSSDQPNSSECKTHQQEASLFFDRKQEVSQVNNNETLIKDAVDTEGSCQDYMITSSPYENRLSDWINSMSKEQWDNFSGSFGCESYNGFGYFLGDWSFRDGSEYNCKDTMCDVDLFNVNNLDVKTWELK